MSISSEITRITNARDDIAGAIEEMGVTVPSGTQVDGLAALVRSGVNGHIQDYNNPHQVTPGQVGGIYYGRSSTSGSTVIKQVNIPEITNLYSGLSVRISFLYGNTVDSPQLQINTLAATPICWTGTTGALKYDWTANTVLDLIYDTYSNSSSPVWKLIDHQHASTNRWGIVLLNESTIDSASDAASSKAVRYLQAELAPIEANTTASEAYTTGQYFSKSGNFCRALTDIAKSATFTLNTNYASTKIADWLPQELAYNLTTNAKFTSLSGRVTRVGNMVILSFRGTASEAMSSNTEIIRIPYNAPGSDGQILSMWRGNTAYTCRINAGTISSVSNGRIYTNTAISANDNISITGIYFL